MLGFPYTLLRLGIVAIGFPAVGLLLKVGKAPLLRGFRIHLNPK